MHYFWAYTIDSFLERLKSDFRGLQYKFEGTQGDKQLLRLWLQVLFGLQRPDLLFLWHSSDAWWLSWQWKSNFKYKNILIGSGSKRTNVWSNRVTGMKGILGAMSLRMDTPIGLLIWKTTVHGHLWMGVPGRLSDALVWNTSIGIERNDLTPFTVFQNGKGSSVNF